jgi:hypothetical protein
MQGISTGAVRLRIRLVLGATFLVVGTALQTLQFLNLLHVG